MSDPVVEEPLEQDGAGEPDGFRRLWMQHRMAYIKGENRATSDECPFCRLERRCIRLEDEHAAAIPDGFAVTEGHTLVVPRRHVASLFDLTEREQEAVWRLMVCPYRHVADYTELDEAETIELAQHTKLAMTALRAASGAQGFNIGMNMGGVAGAGIAGHLHQHVVPRWGGDTNFMPVVAGVKVLPQLLGETREMLADAWPDTVSGVDPAPGQP